MHCPVHALIHFIFPVRLLYFYLLFSYQSFDDSTRCGLLSNTIPLATIHRQLCPSLVTVSSCNLIIVAGSLTNTNRQSTMATTNTCNGHQQPAAADGVMDILANQFINFVCKRYTILFISSYIIISLFQSHCICYS